MGFNIGKAISSGLKSGGGGLTDFISDPFGSKSARGASRADRKARKAQIRLQRLEGRRQIRQQSRNFLLQQRQIQAQQAAGGGVNTAISRAVGAGQQETAANVAFIETQSRAGTFLNTQLSKAAKKRDESAVRQQVFQLGTSIVTGLV